MIECMTFSTANEFGDALVDYHRMRYRLFIEREGWDIPHFDNLEYDEFDTPATVYLIKRRPETGEVMGGMRLIPTTQPYLAEHVWPNIIQTRPIPKDPKVWEGTRMSADPELSVEERRQTLSELGIGFVEFLLSVGADRVIFEMPPKLLEFQSRANPEFVERLGEPITLDDGTLLVGGWIHLSETTLAAYRAGAGVTDDIVTYPKASIPYRKAA